ncbi:cyclin-D4-1-like isoform X2 [Malania oleifera]|uniref:cyclin-D4-1-like isoform X2 n=1 Tax=Malania oleifera TaxID=397392 RepID=UPI0025AE823C|nr:cyclin-D4-1-like isoform X2 [Malania oleifera]
MSLPPSPSQIQSQSQSQSPEHSATSSLYCPEDAGDVASSDVDAAIWISPPPPDYSLSDLLLSEPHHMPLPDYLRRCRDRSVDLTARQDSINWILKVHAFYRFRPVTAMLSVNYLDRFLSSNALPQGNGWPFQLLSVACLSLAAKMEEPQVPLLIALQAFEPRFVFEPKTVQRMELFVMSNLKWRLRSVTPFDYLDYFISRLPSSSSVPSQQFFGRVLSVSSDLILRTTRDFLGFPPSAIAAAAVLSAAGESVDLSAANDRLLPASYCELVNKEMVRSCHQLMEEYLVDTCPAARHKERTAEPPAPPSPVGVLDAAACGSCDTRSGNPGSGQAEPPNKRPRPSLPDVHRE